MGKCGRGALRGAEGSGMSSDEELGDGLPHSGKSNIRIASYITNGSERRRFFAERIKAIRSRVETFARCTGENILVTAVDEDGRAHHWGTSAFQKFVADERVTSIMYRYLNEFQPIMPSVQTRARRPRITDKMQLAHLRALVRSQLTKFSATDDEKSSSAPPQWPPSVPFRPPGDLDSDQLISVAKAFMNYEAQNPEEGQRMLRGGSDERAEDKNDLVWDSDLPPASDAGVSKRALPDKPTDRGPPSKRARNRDTEWEQEPLHEEEKIEEELPTDIGALIERNTSY